MGGNRLRCHIAGKNLPCSLDKARRCGYVKGASVHAEGAKRSLRYCYSPN